MCVLVLCVCTCMHAHICATALGVGVYVHVRWDSVCAHTHVLVLWVHVWVQAHAFGEGCAGTHVLGALPVKAPWGWGGCELTPKGPLGRGGGLRVPVTGLHPQEGRGWVPGQGATLGASLSL